MNALTDLGYSYFRNVHHGHISEAIIEKRISQFLEDTDFKDEFSHTLLHN
jgi:hypothetical protein